MSKYYNAKPTNYAEANEILGSRRELKIAHNTTIRRVDSDTIAIRLHYTDVVTFHDGLPSGHGSGWIGWTVLNSGGWQTVTTKERINRYLPEGWKLSQHDWEWTVSWPDEGLRCGKYANFVDGFKIHHFTTGSSPIKPIVAG
jgi:hypothetical protein